MRLADWDAATTAHYRRLWTWANTAHRNRGPGSTISSLLALLSGDVDVEAVAPQEGEDASSVPVSIEDLLSEGPTKTPLTVDEYRRRQSESGDSEASGPEPGEDSTSPEGDEPAGADAGKGAAESGVEEKRRWRVLYALGGLLSTQPPILLPERLLREAVLTHCARIGKPLQRSRKGIPEWKRAALLAGKPAVPEPPPLEEHRALWKQVADRAEKIEKAHGPITRLSPLLERLGAEPELPEALLMGLWKEAIALIEREPANPVPINLIRYFDGERNRAASYRRFELPKRRGGTRTITTPRKRLKWLQRSLLQVLTHLFPRHKCAVGFERGESVVMHAKAHAGKRWVYVVDIQDFFPSITRNRVYGMLRAKPFQASEPVARYLANLVSVDGALPQGAPTSPILANLLCRRMDARLFKWARERGYQYTRYADDLAFSTNRAGFPAEDRQRIVEIVEDEGFAVHPEKRKLMPWYGRQLVTGLVVNEKPNVPREYVRGLRALLFNVKTFGWESQVGRQRLAFKEGGWLLYKRRALSYADFLKVEQLQREGHVLVRPGTELSRVHTVEQLRRVVRGKIAFVGAVKGKDHPVYLDLLRRYREALPQALAAEQARRRFDEARRLALRTYTPESAPDHKPEDAPHHYRDFKAAMGELLDGNADREAVFGWLEERAGESLECRWLLKQALPTTELVEKAQRVAYALDTHPHETAQFFREFNTYRSFRGLLHAPSEQDGEQLTYPDGTVLSIGEIVGNCERALADRTLTNELKTETERVIKACKEWLRLYPTKHPWLADDNDLRETLLGYVYLTRFQPKLLRAEGVKSKYNYEKGRRLDFFARLQPFVEKLKEGQAERVHLGRRGLRFHMYAPPLREAVEILIHNIVEKGFNAHVELERVVDPRRGEIKITVWTDGGPLPIRPDFDDLLGGDTQGVLYLLRGYANWTIEAPFLDDGVHQFDVMSAKSRSLAGTPTQGLPGLRHIITVYQ